MCLKAKEGDSLLSPQGGGLLLWPCPGPRMRGERTDSGEAFQCPDHEAATLCPDGGADLCHTWKSPRGEATAAGSEWVTFNVMTTALHLNREQRKIRKVNASD